MKGPSRDRTREGRAWPKLIQAFQGPNATCPHAARTHSAWPYSLLHSIVAMAYSYSLLARKLRITGRLVADLPRLQHQLGAAHTCRLPASENRFSMHISYLHIPSQDDDSMTIAGVDTRVQATVVCKSNSVTLVPEIRDLAVPPKSASLLVTSRKS